MKKISSVLFYVTAFAMSIAPLLLYGQPDPGNNNGGGPLGGGAPIGGGLGILLALALGYGLKKLWDNYKRKLNE